MAPDQVTRPTPWSLVFAPLESRYTALATTTSDPAAFSRDPEAQRLLAEIESPDLIDAVPTAAAEYVHLLFADVEHWRAGRPVRAATPDLTTTPDHAALPGGAVYLQLPLRTYWLQPDPAGPHEPLDGCYLVPVTGRALVIVAVLGLRAERQGLSQVTLVAAASDLAAAAGALPEQAFAPAMDGGKAAGFRSVRTAAELLHLVRLALAASEA